LIAPAWGATTIHRVRRSLPFFIIAGVLVVALGAGWFLYRARMEPEPEPVPKPSSPTPVSLPTATPAPTLPS